jgi:CRP-like cAMP-binding protein
MEELIKQLSNKEDTSIELKTFLQKNTQQKTIPKGTILQSIGTNKLEGYYVKKGLLRSYIIDEKGKLHIYMFAPEGWFIMDMVLLSKEKEGILYIDALEASEIVIMKEDIFKYPEKLSVNILIKDIDRLVNRIITLQKRVFMLMSMPAKERYIDFLKTYPQIAQRIPQKMIASYLGITPEVLSGIRSKMNKER